MSGAGDMERGAGEALHDGACHCGAVRFRVKLNGGMAGARRCDCSFCAMRGAVVLSAHLGDFSLICGGEALSLYTFGTGEAKHYFCKICGVYTHHKRRSNPREYGINAACLQGVSPFDFLDVPVHDGINHPRDSGVDRISGLLRFERS